MASLVLACMLTAMTTVNDGDDANAILSRLQKYDEANLRAITIHSQISFPVRKRSIDTERQVMSVLLTRDGEIIASKADLDPSVPPPKFHKGNQLTAEDFTKFGDLIVWRQQHRLALGEPGIVAAETDTIVFNIQPNGAFTKQRGSALVYRHDRIELLQVLDLRIVMLCSGHGYGRLIKEITSVVRRDTGLLACRATGKTFSGGECYWEFTVEPKSGYLVRSAKCTRRTNKALIEEMNNEGIMWTPRGAFPKTARITSDPALPDNSPEKFVDVTFLKIDDAPDTGLIASNRKFLQRKYQVGTIVFDNRGGKDSHELIGEDELFGQPDKPEPVEVANGNSAGLPGPAKTARFGIYVLVCLVFLALLAVLVFWRLRVRKNVPPSSQA